MIYVSDLSDFERPFFEAAIEFLPTIKKAEIKRISHEHSKNESVLAWVLLKFVLSDYGSEIFERLRFTERGKPYFSDGKPYFNLSHSGNKVCVAISDSNEIGIDIQKESNFSPNMIKRVFSDNERNSVDFFGGNNRFFTKLWAVKESFLKYTGAGISVDLKSIDFSKELNQSVFIKNNLYYSTFEIDDYFISACTKENDRQSIKAVPAIELINYVKNNGCGCKGEY
ncbi:MAG: 4'-phosphopantetheinyl transferase superfamily protein [Clostridia bacterium]|nr:4'-phosphopantetheinyl transferase superfamily protein [Clostridia bacterium]